MNASPINNIFDTGKCLDVESMRKYAAGKLDKQKRHTIEKHLIDCELCSLAVEGASEIALTQTDIKELHQKIDEASSSEKRVVKPGKFFIIAAIALLSAIISPFFFPEEGTKTIPDKKENPAIESNHKEHTGTLPETNTITNLTDNNTNASRSITGTPPTSPHLEKLPEVGKLEKRELFLQTHSLSLNVPEIKTAHQNNDIIYMHNCKVVMSRKLYYNGALEIYLLRNTPSPLEKKKAAEKDTEKSLSAISILDNALIYFSSGSYKNAFDEFSLLLENNNNDINAAFYSAICLYNLNDIKGAKSRLSPLLRNAWFGEEANWYYALCLVRENNLKEAESRLKAIIEAKGFYTEAAKEKLAELK